MKTIKLFFSLTIISCKLFGQDPTWKTKIFSEILTLSLPAKTEHQATSFIRAFGGEIDATFYGFEYYDTIFNRITTANQFQIALTGYISGRISDPALKRYDVTVVDTSIGQTQGLLAKFITSDTSEAYKQVYYYVTIANNHFYLFYVYTPFPKFNDKNIEFFFRSIKFNSNKIQEKPFKLTPVNLKKKTD